MEKKILLIFGTFLLIFGGFIFSSSFAKDTIVCAQNSGQVYFGQRECISSAPSYCPAGYQKESGLRGSIRTELCVDFSPRFCEVMTGSSEVVVINNFFYCARNPLESIGTCERGSDFRKFNVNTPIPQQVQNFIDSLRRINSNDNANLIRTTDQLLIGLSDQEIDDLTNRSTGIDPDNVSSFVCRDTSRLGGADMKLMIPIVIQNSPDGIDGYNRESKDIQVFEQDVLANGFIFNRQQSSPARTGYCAPGQLYIGEGSSNEACYDTRTAFPTSYCKISNPPVDGATLNGSIINNSCIRSDSNNTNYIYGGSIDEQLQANTKSYILSNDNGDIINALSRTNGQELIDIAVNEFNGFNSCNDIYGTFLDPDPSRARIIFGEYEYNNTLPNSPGFISVDYVQNINFKMYDFFNGLISGDEDIISVLNENNDSKCMDYFSNFVSAINQRCSVTENLNVYPPGLTYEGVLTCELTLTSNTSNTNNPNISSSLNSDFETTTNQNFCFQTSSELLDGFSNKGCSRLATFNPDTNTITPGGGDYNSCVDCLYSNITNNSRNIPQGTTTNADTNINTMISQNYTYIKQNVGVSITDSGGKPLSVVDIQTLFASGDVAGVLKQNPYLEPFVTPRLGFTYTDLGCINSSNTSSIINTIIRSVLILASGIVVVRIIQGAITMQQGNAEGFQEGQAIVVSAIAGLLVIIFSIVLLNFIGINVLGFGTENGGFFSPFGG
jgi:hypothetical protein